MAEPYESTPDCRCPDGWPTPMATFKAGNPTVVLRHHLGDCGLPDEVVDDECEGSP